MPRTNHVFIDYENLQPQNVPALDEPDIRLVVLVGVRQKKIPVDLAASLQPLGKRAEYVEIDATGPNALDFHIAYLAGRTTASDPEASVHIVSRDKGFDPLVRYLRNTGVPAFRVDSLKFLMRAETVKALDLDARALLAWEMVDQFSGRPKTVERLHKTLMTLFQGGLQDNEIQEVVTRLEELQRIRVSGQDIAYKC